MLTLPFLCRSLYQRCPQLAIVAALCLLCPQLTHAQTLPSLQALPMFTVPGASSLNPSLTLYSLNLYDDSALSAEVDTITLSDIAGIEPQSPVIVAESADMGFVVDPTDPLGLTLTAPAGAGLSKQNDGITWGLLSTAPNLTGWTLSQAGSTVTIGAATAPGLTAVPEPSPLALLGLGLLPLGLIARKRLSRTH